MERRRRTRERPQTSSSAKDGKALTGKELSAIDDEGNEKLSSLARQATALSKRTDIGNYDANGRRFIKDAEGMVPRSTNMRVNLAGKAP